MTHLTVIRDLHAGVVDEPTGQVPDCVRTEREFEFDSVIPVVCQAGDHVGHAAIRCPGPARSGASAVVGPEGTHTGEVVTRTCVNIARVPVSRVEVLPGAAVDLDEDGPPVPADLRAGPVVEGQVGRAVHWDVVPG